MAENSDVDKWDEHLEQLIGKSVMSRNLCIAHMYVCMCVCVCVCVSFFVLSLSHIGYCCLSVTVVSAHRICHVIQ